MHATEPITIPCEDGFTLRGTLYTPARSRGVAVIVCAAIFVRERFYARFAAHLAGRGYRVITFGNRGQGVSLDAGGPGRRPRLRHWGERDLPAVVACARSRAPGDRLFVVGHSMGGQLVGLTEAVHELDGVVTVAATAAWWGHWPRPQRHGILAFYLTLPIVGRALKVLPAGRFGLGPDLHSDVARAWVRWGRSPDYFLAPRFGIAHQMGRYRGRVLALSFTDDALGAREAVDALHRRWTAASLTRRHVAPSGNGSLGHFGYFRAGPGPALWEETIAWMEASSDARR